MSKLLLGYNVTTLSPEECVDKILGWIDDEGVAKWVSCLNPHSTILAENDPNFMAALKDSDLLLPDGIGIILASRILKNKIKRRITGMDIFIDITEQLNKREGIKYFFLGSTGEVLKKMIEHLAEDYPNIKVVGSLSPPFVSKGFTQEQSFHMVQEINDAEPHVL